jgi:hypothetical protein
MKVRNYSKLGSSMSQSEMESRSAGSASELELLNSEKASLRFNTARRETFAPKWIHFYYFKARGIVAHLQNTWVIVRYA